MSGARVGEELLGGRRRRGVAVASEHAPELSRQPENDSLPGHVVEDDAGQLAADERLRRVAVRPPEAAKPPERPSERDVGHRDGSKRLVDAAGGRVDRERVTLGELVRRTGSRRAAALTPRLSLAATRSRLRRCDRAERRDRRRGSRARPRARASRACRASPPPNSNVGSASASRSFSSGSATTGNGMCSRSANSICAASGCAESPATRARAPRARRRDREMRTTAACTRERRGSHPSRRGSVVRGCPSRDRRRAPHDARRAPRDRQLPATTRARAQAPRDRRDDRSRRRRQEQEDRPGADRCSRARAAYEPGF